MKKKVMLVIGLFIAGAVLLDACKKKEDDATPSTSTSQKADDAAARNELDRVQSDIETVYNSDQYAGNQRATAVDLPCGSVTLNTNNYTINYNGVNCGSRVLSGSIDVQLVNGTKFSDAGAKLQVTFNNYKVHYNASGQEIVYNGTSYITNETGGTLVNLFTTTPDTIVHKTRGALTLTYDTTGVGGSTFQRTWNLFRKKTFMSDGTPTGISLKFEGDTTIATDTYLPGTYASVCEYGLDVDNRKFIHDVPTPFLWSNCGTDYSGPYVLHQGEVVHTAFTDAQDYKFQFTATAGYKSNNGSPVVDHTCSSDGYQIQWTATRVSDNTTILNYSTFQQY